MERQADRGSSHSREVLAGDRQNDRAVTDNGVSETPQAPVVKRPGANGPCWVYRYFDTRGQLLYVGITTDLDARDEKHRSSVGPFSIYIGSRTCVKYPTINDARAVEWDAIKSENPPFNVSGATAESHAVYAAFMADPINVEIKRAAWRANGVSDEGIGRIEAKLAELAALEWN